MLRALIDRKLKREEERLGGSLDYVRQILRTSLRAFFKFLKFLPPAEYRRTLPPAAYHTAKLVATQDADCGTCLQVEVNLALRAGVPAEIVKYVLAGHPEVIPHELGVVYHFTREVLAASGEEDVIREQVRKHFGEEGLVELALAIASCRVFPVVKRTLGHAQKCEAVEIKVV